MLHGPDGARCPASPPALHGRFSRKITWLRTCSTPLCFPSISALAFWPQFADHLMWGALLGATLQLRLRRGASRRVD
jgi:hypothetical protein